MTDAESLLSPVLDKIAKEQKYGNYKKILKSINSEGGNYSSLIYNITISAPGKDDLRLFAKVANVGEQLRSLISSHFFETEILFYTTIIPKYREIEEKYHFPKNSRFVLPKYYGGSNDNMKETLVLEELTSKGFESFDRFQCYDWEYASKSISILARLHAMSIRYEKDDPEEFADLTKNMKFQLPFVEIEGLKERSIEVALSVIANENKGRLEKFIEEHITKKNNFLDLFYPNKKIVLSHGDIRPSNIIHRKDKNGNLEVMVIDYQVMHKGNPVTDLLYFLISGSDEDFRRKHWTQYFEHYYEEFSKTLRWMEINPDDVYSKADYDADVKEMIPCGLTISMFMLPFITVDVENVPNLEDGFDVDSLQLNANTLFDIRFNGLVNDYVKMGII